jgi:phage-related protein
MLYIGTSLGGCLLSLISGEVSEKDVMVIITRTNAPTYERFIDVVKAYHAQGNPYASNPERYELDDYKLDDLIDLATRLWNSGKIHQPRSFMGDSLGIHPFRNGDKLWFQVVPTNENNTPAVVDAYEKYKMLDVLTR